MITSGDRSQSAQLVRLAADDEHVLVGVCVEPHGFIAVGHVHPNQTEVLKVIDGTVGFDTRGETIVARPGQKVIVEPRTAGRFSQEE